MDKNTTFLTKSDYVFKLLKEQIISHKLKPGTDLIISKISKDFNMSPIPVREALKVLANAGFAEIEPHKTAKVATFNLEKLRQIGTVRAGLEGYSARLAVDYVNQKQLDKLYDFLNNTRDAMENNDSEAFNAENKKFHRFIYRIAPFPMLYDMIFHIWDLYQWTGTVFAISPERMKDSVEEHKEIVDAIKDRLRNKVERLVRKHRLKATKQLEDNLIRYKDQDGGITR